MKIVFNVLGGILCSLASYQVLTDSIQQPLVSAALGFAVGWFFLLAIINDQYSYLADYTSSDSKFVRNTAYLCIVLNCTSCTVGRYFQLVRRNGCGNVLCLYMVVSRTVQAELPIRDSICSFILIPVLVGKLQRSSLIQSLPCRQFDLWVVQVEKRFTTFASTQLTTRSLECSIRCNRSNYRSLLYYSKLVFPRHFPSGRYMDYGFIRCSTSYAR